MLTLPERTPQFTVMRAVWSSTIERVNLHRFCIYLCSSKLAEQVVLASAEALAGIVGAGSRSRLEGQTSKPGGTGAVKSGDLQPTFF